MNLTEKIINQIDSITEIEELVNQFIDEKQMIETGAQLVYAQKGCLLATVYDLAKKLITVRERVAKYQNELKDDDSLTELKLRMIMSDLK